MNTIQCEWEDFERKILDPINAGETQRREMKRAFYAGVYTQMHLSLSLSEHNEEAALAILQGLMGEVIAFRELVKAGKA